MSKLAIYLVVGAVILIYQWVSSALKEGTAKHKAPRHDEADHRRVSEAPQWKSTWAEFEEMFSQNAREVAPEPAPEAPKRVPEAPKPAPRPSLPEEGVSVTARVDNSEAEKAEQRRNDRLRAHYDRWRRAVVDTQVLERKF
ncbi:MAG: hypothetical protein K2K49_02455 [Duncaniella sp.]|nr:hypothetical protein [Duncaniella sp.]